MKKLFLLIMLMSCASHHASVAVLPEPPIHPALEQPDLMSEEDRTRLADFIDAMTYSYRSLTLIKNLWWVIGQGASVPFYFKN